MEEVKNDIIKAALLSKCSGYLPAGTLSGRLDVRLTLHRREDGTEIGGVRNFGLADK
jgi:hypothetical protein